MKSPVHVLLVSAWVPSKTLGHTDWLIVSMCSVMNWTLGLQLHRDSDENAWMEFNRSKFNDIIQTRFKSPISKRVINVYNTTVQSGISVYECFCQQLKLDAAEK